MRARVALLALVAGAVSSPARSPRSRRRRPRRRSSAPVSRAASPFPARGSRCPPTARYLPARVPEAAGPRRRPGRALDLEGHPRELGGEDRHADPLRHEHDRDRPLPRLVGEGETRLLPAGAGLHPAAEGERALDGLGPDHEAGRSAGPLADLGQPPARRTQTVARACGKNGKKTERLIGGWSAITFGTKDTTTPPDPALASKVHLQLTIGDVRVVASVRTDASMPAGAIPRSRSALCAVNDLRFSGPCSGRWSSSRSRSPSSWS